VAPKITFECQKGFYFQPSRRLTRMVRMKKVGEKGSEMKM